MALCQKVSDFMPNFKGGSRLVRCSFLFALINLFLEACVRVFFLVLTRVWFYFNAYAKNDRIREEKYLLVWKPPQFCTRYLYKP